MVDVMRQLHHQSPAVPMSFERLMDSEVDSPCGISHPYRLWLPAKNPAGLL
jgi:hypothetical protein